MACSVLVGVKRGAFKAIAHQSLIVLFIIILGRFKLEVVLEEKLEAYHQGKRY